MADEAAPVVLEAKGLRRSFGGLVAVDGVDLQVRRGSLTGIIGPNGAGKSTLFQLLAGALRPDRGQVLIQGKDVTRLPAHRRARLGLARTFQITRPLARMTVDENVRLAAPAQLGERAWASLAVAPRVARQEREVRRRASEILEFLDLVRVRTEYAGALSGGQKKLLELARVLMLEPKVVLLDEPMAGVNPTLAKEILEKIDELRRSQAITFVLVEHDLETVFTRCQPIVVMAQGRILAQGDADAIRGNEAVVEAYLGG